MKQAMSLVFDTLLLARGLRDLLDWGESHFEEPARGLINQLRSTLSAINNPAENAKRALEEVIFGEQDEEWLVDQIAIYSHHLREIHQRLRYLAKFEVPPELDSTFRLRYREFKRSFPEEVFFSSTSDFRLLERQHGGADDLRYSVVTVPAALTVLPLFWPLLSHEIGHRWLRTADEDGVRLEAEIASPDGEFDDKLAPILSNWRREVACDAVGLHLFGASFAAPLLSHVTAFHCRLFLHSTATHPAPSDRWKLIQTHLDAGDAISSDIKSRSQGIVALLESSSSGRASKPLDIICRSCSNTIETLEFSEMPPLESEMQSAFAQAQELLSTEFRPLSGESYELEPILEALKSGLPVDLAFNHTGLNKKEDLSTLLNSGRSEVRTAILKKIEATAPPVDQLFAAAWSERFRIEDLLSEEVRSGNLTRQTLRPALDDALDKIHYIGDNIKMGIRSITTLTRIKGALSNAAE